MLHDYHIPSVTVCKTQKHTYFLVDERIYIARLLSQLSHFHEHIATHRFYQIVCFTMGNKQLSENSMILSQSQIKRTRPFQWYRTNNNIGSSTVPCVISKLCQLPNKRMSSKTPQDNRQNFVGVTALSLQPYP